jgi:hypothetical protein
MDESVSKVPPADAVNVVSYFLAMAVVPGDESATYSRFFDYLAAMVRAWPQSSAIFDNAFWGWPNKWPIRRNNGYWKFALTKRAVE